VAGTKLRRHFVIGWWDGGTIFSWAPWGRRMGVALHISILTRYLAEYEASFDSDVAGTKLYPKAGYIWVYIS
jgi:hypothetical protein